MLGGNGLVVSLPARELQGCALPGSLFECQDLDGTPISHDLRAAVELVEEACAARGLPMLLLARPEIFTHGETLAWLIARLGEIGDHLCISDGTTVRLVPGLRNHLFLYRLGIQENALALRRLVRRAPELFSTIASQVNTAFSFRCGAAHVTPAALPLRAERCRGGPKGEEGLLRFYLRRNAVERSVGWITEQGTAPLQGLAAYKRLVYVLLTETAGYDLSFCDFVASMVAKVYFNPETCVVLRLPDVASPAPNLAQRLTAALSGLNAPRSSIPAAPAHNVFFADADMDPNFLLSRSSESYLVTHDTFNFWRYDPPFYAGFSTIQVLVATERYTELATAQAMFTQVLGRTPQFHWLQTAED